MAGLQASAVIFPNMELKAKYDRFWMNLDIHRNNAVSSVAMETAFNEGEEWLEQLLVYISDNFDFIKDYCEKYIPQDSSQCSGRYLSGMAGLPGAGNEQ